MKTSMKFNVLFFGYMATQAGTSIQQTLVWMVPPFVVQVLLYYFQRECMKTEDENLLEKSKHCLLLHESLTDSFSYFFICYFAILQLYSIFMTFLFLSALPLILSFSVPSTLLLFGFILQLTCNVIWLMTMTSSIEKCSERIKDLKSQLQEKLLCTYEKQERQYLKYMIQRIGDLKQMNACGYFTVNKSTLTSMVSVR